MAASASIGQSCAAWDIFQGAATQRRLSEHFSLRTNLISQFSASRVLTGGTLPGQLSDVCCTTWHRHVGAFKIMADARTHSPRQYHARRRKVRSSGPCGSRKSLGESESEQMLGRSTKWQQHMEHSKAGTTCEATSRSRGPHGQLDRGSAWAGPFDRQVSRIGASEDYVWDPLGVYPLVRFSSSGGGDQGQKNESQSDEGSRSEKSSSSRTPKTSSGLSNLDAYFEKLEATKAAHKTDASSSSSSSSAVAEPRQKQGLGTPASTGSIGEGSGSSATSASPVKKVEDDENAPKTTKALRSLDAYFDKLRPPPPPEKEEPPSIDVTAAKRESILETDPVLKEQMKELPAELRENPEFKKVWKEIDDWVNDSNKANPNDPSKPPVKIEIRPIILEQTDFEKWVDGQKEIGAPWLVNLFLVLDILVYILELGSPELEPDNIMTSLPSLYMAKVNQLVTDGEWWRLITPSFLHSGFLHLLISVWTLWSLGPQVEVALGPLGFAGAFLFGGVCGNLLSFFVGDQITVGGTGPIFAIAGAWIVYLLRNREAIGKEWADGEIRKVAFLAALNVALGSPAPIDDWTHIGSFFGGGLYSALVAPKLIRISQKKTNSPKTSIFGGLDLSNEATEDIGFLSAGPGTKQYFWIYALCTGILVGIYFLGTQTSPQDLGLGPQDLFI